MKGDQRKEAPNHNVIEKQSSHIDMHIRAGSAFDNCVTLTFDLLTDSADTQTDRQTSAHTQTHTKSQTQLLSGVSNNADQLKTEREKYCIVKCHVLSRNPFVPTTQSHRSPGVHDVSGYVIRTSAQWQQLSSK